MSYSLTPYSEFSVVLRTQPPDLFKAYKDQLLALNGKWNPNLKSPDGNGVLGGWIFSKKMEPQVDETAIRLLQGGPPPTPQSTYTTNRPTLTPTVQNLSVFRPFVGQPLQLNVNGQLIRVEVASVQTDQSGLAVSGSVRTSDGQLVPISLIQPRWEVPGYNVPHSLGPI